MQEEIDLRDVIAALWNGKAIIALVTTISIIVATAINWFVLDPVYEVKSSVRISLRTNDSEPILTSLLETATNDVHINSVIEKLNLDRDQYSIEEVRKAVKVELSKDSKVLKFTVKGKEVKDITRIANQMAFSTGARLEISDLSNEIINYTLQFQNVERDIEVLNEELNETRIQLENTPEFIVTKQVLANDPLLQSIVSEQTGMPIQQIAGMQLESEIRNPVYTSLTDRLATLQIELSKKTATKKTLEDQINQVQREITDLEERLNDEFLTSSRSELSLNGKNAIFISPAMEPTSPVEPNKLMNVALTAVISFVLSAAYVFFRHYLKMEISTVVNSQHTKVN